ncbi:MAG: ATP-dependent zinc metalloprotease FtsH [Actinobacteria bacterium]|nr:ATP-dependent zinc metalloprotease FtsH [Actinomycetota bacterium]
MTSHQRSHLPDDEGRPRMPEPDGSDRPDSPFDLSDGWKRWLLIVGAVLLGVAVTMTLIGPPAGEELVYSQFLQRVQDGEVATVTINNDSGKVTGELDNGDRFTTTIPTDLEQQELTEALRENDVEVSATSPGRGFWSILIGFAPFLLLIGLFWFLSRRAQGQLSQMSGMGKSQAELIDTERPDTTFDDVAGYEGVKREVREIIDYLTEPERYQEAGARGPGGVLMVGPPGTGKTLMARAIAGEADVPFMYAAGSTFVQMLVGVGASRVRDLFDEARDRAPSIIFIDELDSIGRKRGGTATIGANNEQEQTLNQLLAEMDGFDPSEGVVVIAATNRPQLLDEALMRPGRFDREIRVDLPRQNDRLDILRIHTQDKDLSEDVDLDLVARGTPGFSGAELENLCNEAAIFAVRHDRTQVTAEDFERARDRIMIGRRDESNMLTQDEQRRVAIHESGHAIIGALCENADPVEKVSILPAGRALGVTHTIPLNERRLQTEGYLHDTLAVRMGGRAAEEVILGEGSTGSASDLAGATQLATKMVRDFGLSGELGPVGYAQEQQGQPSPLRQRPFAEETQRNVDQEVERILRDAEDRALKMLKDHRDELRELIERLLEEETVDGAEVYRMLGLEKPVRDEDAQEDDATVEAGEAS